MDFHALLDFLIRHRRWIVSLVPVVIAALGYWLVVIFARRAPDVPNIPFDANLSQLFALPLAAFRADSQPQESLIRLISQIGGLVFRIIAVTFARATALWKPVGLIVLAVFLCIGGFLWWYDRNEKAIVTAGLTFPSPQCNPEPRAGVVIFIHGWTGDVHETWKRFPELMCGDKRFAAFEVVSVGYPTLMRSRELTVSQIADWLREELRNQLKIAAGEKVIFVAHSMGGLIAREVTLLQRLSQSPGSIEMLAEIATPHNGALVAPLASALGLSKEMTNDMLEGSNTIKSLQVRWNALAGRPETTCYSSPQDKVVSEASAFYQCDHQLAFPVWSHTEMVKPESREDSRYALPMQRVADRLGVH
ncbi:MAG TPA: alpha/beta hydrolase [Bryobacteraceae bacterium]